MKEKPCARVIIDITTIDKNEVEISASVDACSHVSEVQACLYSLAVLAERGAQQSRSGTLHQAIFEKVYRLADNSGWEH